MQSPVAYRAFFVVPPEVHLLDISGPAHVFYEAADYDAPITSYFLSLDKGSMKKSSAGLSIGELEDYAPYTLGENDLVFVPGIEAKLLLDKSFEEANQPFFSWMRRQKENGVKICSVCTGAFLLAQAGILKGMQCTTHWKYIEDFKVRFPTTNIQTDRLFVKDGNVYTSAGVASGIDMALYLLEELFGPFFATQIAKEIVVYLRRTEDDPQLSVFLQYRNHVENRVHKVQDHLGQSLHQNLTIESLAEHVSMSPRNLTRLFKKTTGITIHQYSDKLRVERAVQLLSNGQKVESVALSCGLKSSNQLRTLLQKHKSALPSDLS